MLKCKDGIEGKGGTSRKHAQLLAKYFVEYANNNKQFDIKCKILYGENVTLEKMKNSLKKTLMWKLTKIQKIKY